MKPFSRDFDWGDSLKIVVKKAGGLSEVVRHIHELMGPMVGARNTFDRLFSYEQPPDPTSPDGLRAALLVTAIGEKRSDWGLSQVDFPPAWELSNLPISENGCIDVQAA